MSVVHNQKNKIITAHSRKKRKAFILYVFISTLILLVIYLTFYWHDTQQDTKYYTIPNSSDKYIKTPENVTKNNDVIKKDAENTIEKHVNDTKEIANENTNNKVLYDTNASRENVNLEDLKLANDLLEFYNRAVIILSSEWYSIPHLIEKNISIYTETWELPKLVSNSAERTQSSSFLLSGKNFTCFEGRELENFIGEMDAAIDSMRADYNALEKYINNVEIKDDGRKGNNYVKSIEKNQKKFITARLSWLEIVRPEIAKAEKLLLQNHPFRRHSIIAKNIFDLFTATASVFGQNKIDRKVIHNICSQIDNCLKEANNLSFGNPQYERHYRAFLMATKTFSDYLHEGLSIGFYQSLRKKLNQQISASREAYNKFVASANVSHDEFAD